MSQNISLDPIVDPWESVIDFDYSPKMAMGQVITDQDKKYTYKTLYHDPIFSSITLNEALGDGPKYEWGMDEVILEHSGDQEPWVIDAYAYYDGDTQRLWMAWGGHKCWITELDP